MGDKLQAALNRIQELETENKEIKEENKNLREQLIQLCAEKMKSEQNLDELDEQYGEIYLQNKFLKKRVNGFEQSYDTINVEQKKKLKQKYDINDLNSFMNFNVIVTNRCGIKLIQK